MFIDETLKLMTPELYQRFRRAIELGKWPDGRRLTAEQKEICMQSVIAYEQESLAPHERTGYIPPKSAACDPVEEQVDILNWQESEQS